MRWVNHYHPSSLLSPSRDGHPDGEPTVESAANYVLRIPSKRKKKSPRIADTQHGPQEPPGQGDPLSNKVYGPLSLGFEASPLNNNHGALIFGSAPLETVASTPIVTARAAF